MTEIIIVGTGGLAADITAFFEGTSSVHYKDLSIKGYIDYDYNIDKYWKRYNYSKPVLSDIDNYRITEEEYFVIGIADNEFRKIMINRIAEKGGKFISLIHPTVLLSLDSVIGTGNIIGPHCNIGPNSQIGDFNIILAQSMISHDCIVGNNNFFASSLLSGHVKVGNDNFFGARSTVIPRISLGSRNKIQAGMLIHSDVTDDSVVFYRFKEKIIAMPSENNSEQS